MNLPLPVGISHLELILSGLAIQYLHNNYWIVTNFLLYKVFEHWVHKNLGDEGKSYKHIF